MHQGRAWTVDFTVPPRGSGPSLTLRYMSMGVSPFATMGQHRALWSLKILSWSLIFQMGRCPVAAVAEQHLSYLAVGGLDL